MKIAILGFDTEGRSSFAYFAAQGHELTICDQKTDITVPSGAAAILGENYLDDLDRFDLLVRTAGMQPSKILDRNPGVIDKITTNVNEFLKACPTKNVIGITGTKGKGTTSTLVARMLEADGKDAHLGGNIGVPPLTFMGDLTAESWVVLELSSFQMIDLKVSPHLAACLLVSSEHLDWHSSFDEYLTAKQQLFRWQTPEDKAVYYADNEYSRQVVASSQGQKIPYLRPPGAIIEAGVVKIGGQTICHVDELKLLGHHNWQNACAATTIFWQVSQNLTAAHRVLTSFSGLEHRLEFVRELDGVRYYDDSFGTTPETAIVAIQAFKQPKVLVLGGSDKGADYSALAQAVKDGGVRKVILIGEQGFRIQTALEAIDFINFMPGGSTMPEIVERIQQSTQPGDIALLSPACASFDLFKNYKDRGEQFKAAVRALV